MNKTIEIIRKKMAGTAIIALFVMGLALSTSSVVQALFISTNGTVNVDGVVTGVVGSSLTISTTGPSITFDTDDKTNIIPKGLTLADLDNAHVRVNAEPVEGGDPLAIVIKKLNNSDPGYGTQGDNVNVNNAVVTEIGESTFTVDIGYTEITFTVAINTNFNGGAKDFSELKVEDEVKVNGEDNGTEFIARTVVVKKK